MHAISVDLPFFAAVALAGLAYVTGETLTSRSSLLLTHYVPEPLIGGLLFAAAFFVLRLGGIVLHLPTSGTPVDFLVSLLTANMGLHVTPKVFRQGYKLSFLFLAAGVLLFLLQFVLVLPFFYGRADWLAAAVLSGPLSFVGAPYNLNPPSQIPPLQDLLAPAFLFPKELAQGQMMLGILAGVPLAALLSKRLFRQAGENPPTMSAVEERTPKTPLWHFAKQETYLIILVLAITAAAFAVQDLLLEAFPGFEEGYLPVIILSYFMGMAFRLAFDALPTRRAFPEAPLRLLLLGPTMSLVLTYAVMSIPLHHLHLLSVPMLPAALFAVSGSMLMARATFPLFARFTDPYYASVISTAFLAVTTGWGPVGMSYLRHFVGTQGRVEPMPVILPLNALFLFPWAAIFLTRLLFSLFGS